MENKQHFDKTKLQDAIKHFEALQKRYTTQHNDRMCDYVDVALTAMRHFKGGIICQSMTN